MKEKISAVAIDIQQLISFMIVSMMIDQEKTEEMEEEKKITPMEIL